TVLASLRNGRRGNIPYLAGGLGKPNHAAGGSGVVNHIRIQRIGNRIAAFSRSNRIPISHRNLPIVAAARDCRRAAVLLRSINPVRETVIGGYFLKFPGWLVVPWTSSLAAVHADGCALVCPQNRSEERRVGKECRCRGATAR